MKNKKLLADSDFFIALYKKSDSNRERAKKFLKKVGRQKRELVISSFSFSEVVTVLSQNTTHENAVNFMEDIERTGVEIIDSDKEMFNKAKNLFKDQTSKNISFVDVFNVIICKFYLGNSEILSFDDDYKKNGLKRYGID